MSTLSRRSLVTSAAALPVAAIPAVAMASADSDAELIELGREFDRVQLLSHDCQRRFSEAGEIYEASRPPVPASVWWRRGDCGIGLPIPHPQWRGDEYANYYCVGDLEKLRAIDHPRARQIVRDVEAYLAADDAAAKVSGYKAAEKADDALHEQHWKPLTEKIIAIQAETLEGMKVKARVVYHCMLGQIGPQDGEETTNEHAMLSIVRDLMRLQGREPITDFEYVARYITHTAVQS